MSDTGDDYEVGYGKPPVKSRFKPKQSGNPKGRPKGSRNMSTILQQQLDAKVPVIENGRRRRITKREVVASKLIEKAMKADVRAIDAMHRLLGQAAITGSSDLSPDDDAARKHDEEIAIAFMRSKGWEGGQDAA